MPRKLMMSFAIVAVLAAAARWRPLAALQAPPRVVIEETLVFPESLTSTSDGTIYVGSIGRRSIFRAAPGASRGVLWIRPGNANLQAVLGVFADEGQDALWVCSTALAAPGASGVRADAETTVKRFDIRNGEPKVSYPFPGGGVCNDIAVGPDGSVYATDTAGARVLRLRHGARALDVWASDPLLASADGVAVLADGVYVNGVRTNRLVRVPVTADGSSGPPVTLDTSRPLSRPDGMRAVGPRTLLLVEGEGRLDEITVDGTRATVRVLASDLDGPTAVTLLGEWAYVLRGQLKYRNDPDLAGHRPGPFEAVAVPYRRPQ
jgi:sugar lactone lactonase YvrE